MAKLFSFTTLRDRWYRYFFSFSGLRSVSKDLGDGTIMHCWIPRTYRPSKPNLLLLHGFGANAMWQYADLLCHFTPKFNVFVPDLLFFGGSFTTRPERSESFQGKCVMKMMDDGFGVHRMSLVGISYGGFVGYSMCAEFPEAVEKLVVCCAGICLEEKDLTNGLFKVSDLEEAERILLAQTPEKLRELMKFSFVKPVKGIPNYFLSDFINVMCSDYLKEKRELIQSILKDRQNSKNPKINQPTLIIWGEKDQIFPLILGERLERHIGENARLVVIGNAGHAVNFEKSKEFAKHLKDFLFDDSISSLSSSVSSLSSSISSLSNSLSFYSCREE
ncbi:monoacylglycerol lipase ABHD6-like [Cynara cardunculus var. scolymus]|uniref:monoacylglycerol lipase ABHD6-like n=1 Tax=Cynara cardunculus var. scolymus TaxID=59895 RepID=UPI000D6314FE|nr:monoacylglycerol lipase ABHD6-like [Cynara cardunculus var. scolymus]